MEANDVPERDYGDKEEVEIILDESSLDPTYYFKGGDKDCYGGKYFHCENYMDENVK